MYVRDVIDWVYTCPCVCNCVYACIYGGAVYVRELEFVFGYLDVCGGGKAFVFVIYLCCTCIYVSIWIRIRFWIGNGFEFGFDFSFGYGLGMDMGLDMGLDLGRDWVLVWTVVCIGFGV